MKIFIAGATGVLGRRLVRMLAERGHDVLGIARTREKAELVRALGGTPVEADLFDERSLAAAAAGAEVVIHAATAIPAPASARSLAAWSMNDRIRQVGTRALTGAAARVGARRYLQQGVVWVVKGQGRGAPYDEDTPPNPPALLRTAVEAEAIARDAGARHGFSVGVLRGGSFYGPDTSSRDMAEMLLARRLPIIGSGENLVASIHPDDMAHAFVLAAESNLNGTWHVVDDQPLPLATVLRTLAEVVGAPAPRSVPLWLARLLAGKHVVESLTTPMNTTNARLRRDLGWAPRYPTVREGLAATAEEWRRAGFPPSAAKAGAKRNGSAARSGSKAAVG